MDTPKQRKLPDGMLLRLRYEHLSDEELHHVALRKPYSDEEAELLRRWGYPLGPERLTACQ